MEKQMIGNILWKVLPYGTLVAGKVFGTVPDTIIVPETVGGIQVKALGAKFLEDANGNVTEVILPETLEEIGEKAFAKFRCKKVVLPRRMKRIGEAAFIGAQINEVVFPDKLDFIAEYAFYRSNINEPTQLLKTVYSVGLNAFSP